MCSETAEGETVILKEKNPHFLTFLPLGAVGETANKEVFIGVCALHH